MKEERYLVTSALPYANGPIHLGHIAGENSLALGLKTAVAGVVSMGLSYLLEQIAR